MEQLVLLDVEDLFLTRMIIYLDAMDANGSHNHNGVYKQILGEALQCASSAHEMGHPKGWFYLRYMEAHAENAGLITHRKPELFTGPYQMSLEF